MIRPKNPPLRAAGAALASACVGLFCVAGLPSAAADGFDYDIGIGFGVESNPLELNSATSSGTFTRLDLDGAYKHRLSERVRFFADAYATARLYESAASDADRTYGRLRTGMSVLPRRWAGGKVAFQFGGTYTLRRSTFVDSATGGVYEVSTSGGPVALDDRYDADTLGMFARAFWKVGARTRLSLSAALEQNDYREDYATIAEISSIDSQHLTLTPSVRFRLTRSANVGASLSFVDRDYDERMALDAAGNDVPGTRREYHDMQYSVFFDFQPAQAWKVRGRVQAADRSDTQAGYYDYGATKANLSVERRFGDVGRLRVWTAIREVDYDNATVPDDPAQEARGKDVQRYAARFDLRPQRRYGWFVEGGTESTDSPDPYWTYDQEWIQAGFRIRGGSRANPQTR